MSSVIKPICGLERVKLSEVIPLNTPFSMFIFPTTYCNFKCIYCGHSLGYSKMKEQYDFSPEFMSMSTYNTIIEQIKQFPSKLKMLSLTGHGEPLLNKELPNMIRIAKQSNITERVEFITNASLLTHELSDALIAAGLDTLRISLQGITAKKYKEICGVEIDFEQFMDNIRYFYNHKKNTQLFVKIMDVALGENEEEKFYALFKDCSDRMYIEKMRPTYDGVEVTKDMQLGYDRYGREHNRRQVCPLPFFMLGIFPNGDVQPCDTLYKPIILGNVYQETIKNMWNSESLKNFWKQQLQGERYSNSKCAVCCAPDDVSHPEDILDDEAKIILERLDRKSEYNRESMF